MKNRLTGIEKTVKFNYETQPQQHDEEQTKKELIEFVTNLRRHFLEEEQIVFPLEAPRSYEKFFPFAIHTVYAVVIAISFDISRTLVVPALNIPDHLVNTGLLILSYFIIVTSWIGYYMTTRKDSYNSLRGI